MAVLHQAVQHGMRLRKGQGQYEAGVSRGGGTPSTVVVTAGCSGWGTPVCACMAGAGSPWISAG